MYPKGGRTLVLNLGYFVKCYVVRPTTDKFIVVGRFFIFVGKFYESFVNDGLESSFLYIIYLIK